MVYHPLFFALLSISTTWLNRLTSSTKYSHPLILYGNCCCCNDAVFLQPSYMHNIRNHSTSMVFAKCTRMKTKVKLARAPKDWISGFRLKIYTNFDRQRMMDLNYERQWNVGEDHNFVHFQCKTRFCLPLFSVYKCSFSLGLWVPIRYDMIMQTAWH